MPSGPQPSAHAISSKSHRLPTTFEPALALAEMETTYTARTDMPLDTGPVRRQSYSVLRNRPTQQHLSPHGHWRPLNAIVSPATWQRMRQRRTVLEIVARGLLGVARQSFQLILVQEPLVGVLAVNLQLAGQ